MVKQLRSFFQKFLFFGAFLHSSSRFRLTECLASICRYCSFSLNQKAVLTQTVCYCQTRVQTMSRPTLDVSQVLSNSTSISDTGGLDLSRHYNCNCCITSCASCITSCAIHQKTFLDLRTLLSLHEVNDKQGG